MTLDSIMKKIIILFIEFQPLGKDTTSIHSIYSRSNYKDLCCLFTTVYGVSVTLNKLPKLKKIN